MSTIIQVPLAQIEPDRERVLLAQGIPRGSSPPPRITALLDAAVDIFHQLAAPVAISADLSTAQFAEIFDGSGKNEADAPLRRIFPRADHLALFACTLGARISERIEERFTKSDFVLGAMLDSAASVGTDTAAAYAEKRLSESLAGKAVLLYSPGYCGWHISGQEKLFRHLHPEEIGISLNRSYLMNPIKSISGVLTAGDREIHTFTNNFPFCGPCRNRSCSERIKGLNQKESEA
jgi:hypothetical protein